MENNNNEPIKKALFAETAVASNAQNYALKLSKFSADRVIELLAEPYKNALELQKISAWMYYNNGIYNRIVQNYAGMNRYDMYLYPTTISKYSKRKVSQEKLYKEYFDIATLIDKLSCKSNFRSIGINLFIQGEVYLYKVEDSQGVILKELPSDLCKISKVINDNLYKYSINMTKLSTPAIYSMMPIQIQQLYDRHKQGLLPSELYTESGYVLVEDKEAICLSLNNNVSTKSIPPLSYLFPSLLRLTDEEATEIIENTANNLKLIHMRYKIDEDGESLIDEEDLRKMHQSAKANLPEGVCLNTSPLEVTAHVLQRSSHEKSSSRQALTELVYNNAGVNSELFNGNNSSNQAILTGLLSDEIVVEALNLLFENYIKYEIKQKKKSSLWNCRFIGNTKYNEIQKSDEAFKGATVGLSRMKLMATQHYSPLEALSILEFETENGIDDLFVPLATSYTQSTKDSASQQEAGRPKASEDDSNSQTVGMNPNSTN